MTQNQSGKQLFEWVKGKPTNPEPRQQYNILFDTSPSTMMFRGSQFYDEAGLVLTDSDFSVIEYLSPSQPSTGKPTEQEAKDLLNWYFGKLSDSKIYGWEDMIEPMIMFAERFTGKQLPTDEEIQTRAEEVYPEQLLKLRMQVGFVNGAKWMRSRAKGESDKWIRVEDGLPEENTNVIIYFINSAGKHITESRFQKGGFYYVAETDSRYFEELFPIVTHWQPLPNAPINK